MPFSGFPRDTLYTPAPDPLLGPLLEEIQDMAELKVALRGLWLLHHKRPVSKQNVRAVALEEFLADTTLLRALGPGAELGGTESSQVPDTATDEIRRGLRLAVRRGILLAHEGGSGKVYFVLNSDAGRRNIARMKQDGAEPEEPAGLGADEPPARPKERPNIYALYEDTIGTLSPIVAERLKEAEDRYPPNWIREVFEIAALENKRSWQYISAILARWGSEGKGGWKGGSNDDGKPGRHSPQDQRQKYSQDYQRRRRNTPARNPGR